MLRPLAKEEISAVAEISDVAVETQTKKMNNPVQ